MPASDYAAMITALAPPRAIWLMLPAGAITEKVLTDLAAECCAGDILIDGGNSFYKDDIRRAKLLAPRGIRYVDAGTSGGVWGLDRGYCLMIGGDEATVRHLDPIFAALAPGIGKIDRTPGRESRDPRVEQGYVHCGPAGAGHFAKMIHNGIEYGLMQAFAEGFDILRKNRAQTPCQRMSAIHSTSPTSPRYGGAAASCRPGCSISAPSRSPMTASSRASPARSPISGEGRWTIEAAIEEAVPADVLAASLFTRFRSRRDHTFAEKLLSAMRYQFGGHVERRSNAATSAHTGA